MSDIREICVSEKIYWRKQFQGHVIDDKSVLITILRFLLLTLPCQTVTQLLSLWKEHDAVSTVR